MEEREDDDAEDADGQQKGDPEQLLQCGAWRVPLRYKVLALAILPLLLAMGVVAWRVAHHAEELAEEQSRLIENQLLSAKRLEL